jgi:hypothetical protein
VLIAPNGNVYRNDDSGVSSCSNCPLVKVDPTPDPGWYTLQISTWNGASIEGNFILLYGLYNSGNPDCASSTVALAVGAVGVAAEAPDTNKPDTGNPGPRPRGGPGY